MTSASPDPGGDPAGEQLQPSGGPEVWQLYG